MFCEPSWPHRARCQWTKILEFVLWVFLLRFYLLTTVYVRTLYVFVTNIFLRAFERVLSYCVQLAVLHVQSQSSLLIAQGWLQAFWDWSSWLRNLKIRVRHRWKKPPEFFNTITYEVTGYKKERTACLIVAYIRATANVQSFSAACDFIFSLCHSD